MTCNSPESPEGENKDYNATLSFSLEGDFTDTVTLEIPFTFYISPTITEINPCYGKLEGGTTVTIYGDHFKGDETYLSCGFGTELVPAQYVNSSVVTCVSPESTVANTPITLKVSQNFLQFTADFHYYVYRSNPVFLSNDPVKGPLSGGTNISIEGLTLNPITVLQEILPDEEFDVDTEMQFASGSISYFHILSQGKGWVISPASLTPQTVELMVTYDGQDYSATGLYFTYYESEEVIELVPNYAYVEDTGLTIRVLGLNFQNSSEIWASYGEGNQECSCEYVSESELLCDTPDKPEQGEWEFWISFTSDNDYYTGLNFTYYTAQIFQIIFFSQVTNLF